VARGSAKARGFALLAAFGSLALAACPSLDDLLAQPDAGSPSDAASDRSAPATNDAAPEAGDAADAAPDDLLAAWEFEGSGITVEDVTGHGHTLALIAGATQGDGGLDGGGALVVHGFDFARADSLAGRAFPRSGTITFFLRYTTDAGSGSLFDGHDEERSHIFVRRVSGAGAIQVALQVVDGGYAYEATFGSNPGTWNHVAIAWDEDAGSARNYINGARFRTRDYMKPFTPDDQRVTLGSGFVGTIDRVRIYTRALTDEEISALSR
jgi:hypothetical protein